MYNRVIPSQITSLALSHFEAITGIPAAYASIIVPGIPSVLNLVGNNKQ